MNKKLFLIIPGILLLFILIFGTSLHIAKYKYKHLKTNDIKTIKIELYSSTNTYNIDLNSKNAKYIISLLKESTYIGKCENEPITNGPQAPKPYMIIMLKNGLGIDIRPAYFNNQYKAGMLNIITFYKIAKYSYIPLDVKIKSKELVKFILSYYRNKTNSQ